MKKILFITLFFALLGGSAYSATELTIYSSRQEQLIKPILDEFEKKYDAKIILHNGVGPQLITRLENEGKNTPADILLTVDAGNLWLAAKKDLFVPIDSKVLENNIPKNLRDPNNLWFGLSVRARTIVYNKKTVKPQQLSTYEDLADKKWAGKLCLINSQAIYTQSLVGSFIFDNGYEKTKKIVSGWVKNLAADPFPNDTTMLQALASGQCQVGISNTYYLARLINQDKDFPVTVFWPDQNGKGVHVNISGAGVIKYSKNKDLAVKLLEFLTTATAQEFYANADFEFPIVKDVKANPIITSWGPFKHNLINVSEVGKNQEQAVKLLVEVGYK